MRPIEIMLVEDNAGDIRLTQEALSDSKIRNNLSVARDGLEALRMLRREGEHASVARPDLIILDLNMPRMDGREFLEVMKSDPALSTIPVAVLTTSQSEADVLKAYKLHANCYITKPLSMDRFAEVVQAVEDFWFAIVTLPGSGEPQDGAVSNVAGES